MSAGRMTRKSLDLSLTCQPWLPIGSPTISTFAAPAYLSTLPAAPVSMRPTWQYRLSATESVQPLLSEVPRSTTGQYWHHSTLTSLMRSAHLSTKVCGVVDLHAWWDPLTRRQVQAL